MLYEAAPQTVAAGGTLTLAENQLNSPNDAIALSGTTGLSLIPGQYLVSFASDASVTAEGTIGAALALDGVAVPYGETALVATAGEGDRITLTTIVAPTAESTLTVINSTASENSYENSTLTVVRLA